MDDEKIIKDLYIKMYKSMIDKDEDILNEIHSDSFVLIHMTGLKQDKKTYINSILDGTLNYYSAETVDLDVTINNNKAKLIGKSIVLAKVFEGSKNKWNLKLVFDLTKENGNWKFTKATANTF